MRRRRRRPGEAASEGAAGRNSPDQRRGRDVPESDLFEVVLRIQQAAPERADQLSVNRIGRRHPAARRAHGVLRRKRSADDRRDAREGARARAALPDRARRGRAGLQHRRSRVRRSSSRVRSSPTSSSARSRSGTTRRSRRSIQASSSRRARSRSSTARTDRAPRSSGPTTCRRSRRSGKRRSAPTRR